MAQDGGRVTEDEVATFVRATLGERDRKRRAAIRDAATKMDDSESAQGRVSVPSVPDSVSGVMLTKTATPPTLAGEEIATSLADAEVTAAIPVPTTLDEIKAAATSKPAGQATESAPTESPAPSSVSEPRAPSSPSLASSPTLAALSAPPAGPRPTASRRNKALAIAASAALGVALAIFTVAKLGTGSPEAATPPATKAPAAAPTTERTAAPAPEPTVADSLATASADATGSEVSIDDLPDNKLDDGSPRPRAPRAGKAPAKPSATAETKATPPAATDPPKAAPPPTTKPNVPAVQDPGF